MRKPPVTSFMMAKRAEVPTQSRRRANTIGPSERLAANSFSTTSPSVGTRLRRAGSSGSGHTSETVSARSPT
jgi:hypothetical protein